MKARIGAALLLAAFLALPVRADTAPAAGKPRDLVNVVSVDEQGGEDRWAVVIGIGNYGKGIRGLAYSANDARAVARSLESECGIPRDHIRLLIDEEATARNIRTAIGTWLAKAAGRRDLVVIYYSGHGAPDPDGNVPEDGIRKYLVSYDTDPADLFATAVPMDDLSSALLRLRSERTVVFLDCCYSGAAAPAGTVGMARTFSRPNVDVVGKLSSGFIDNLALSGRGRAIITGSDPNEQSWEYDDIQHGIFTYHLLKGLAGQAADPATHAVSVNGLYDYVFRSVQASGRQKQTPILATTVAGSLILSRDKAAPPVSDSGILKVLTSPLGAQVFLDRESEPLTTPVERRLSTGPHRITVLKPGYLPVEDEVFVSAVRPTLRNYVLNVEEASGDLLLIAPTGTRVRLDNRDTGVVSDGGLMRIPDLSVGEHTLQAAADGLKPVERTVTIEAGRPTVVRPAFAPATGDIRPPEPSEMPVGMERAGAGYRWTKDGAAMAFVSAGACYVGSDDLGNARPRRRVNVGAFWIDVTEVTNEQFSRFVRETGYRVRGGWAPPDPEMARRPVTRVTLADARAYAAWAGKRLPAEEQWEKAARGPTGLLFPYGDTLNERYQNIRAYGSRSALDVGTLPPGASPYGVYDLLGNVWEWCDSSYVPYPGNASPDPNMGRGHYVIRGGSYMTPALKTEVSAAMRAFLQPSLGQEDVGFRCVAPVYPRDMDATADRL